MAGPERRARFRGHRRRLPSVWIGVGLVLLAPGMGLSHAYLVKSVPARRAVLSRAPTRVELWFNERLEAAYSFLSVWNAEGIRVDAEDAQVGPEDPEKLSVGLRPVLAGTYTVKFRVLSVDGHVVESQFVFTVRTRG